MLLGRVILNDPVGQKGQLLSIATGLIGNFGPNLAAATKILGPACALTHTKYLVV